MVPNDLLCVAREVVAFTSASDEEQDQIVHAQALQVLSDDSVTEATLMAVRRTLVVDRFRPNHVPAISVMILTRKRITHDPDPGHSLTQSRTNDK